MSCRRLLVNEDFSSRALSRPIAFGSGCGLTSGSVLCARYGTRTARRVRPSSTPTQSFVAPCQRTLQRRSRQLSRSFWHLHRRGLVRRRSPRGWHTCLCCSSFPRTWHRAMLTLSSVASCHRAHRSKVGGFSASGLSIGYIRPIRASPVVHQDVHAAHSP